MTDGRWVDGWMSELMTRGVNGWTELGQPCLQTRRSEDYLERLDGFNGGTCSILTSINH